MSPSGELLLERLGLHPSKGGNSPGSGSVKIVPRALLHVPMELSQ